MGLFDFLKGNNSNNNSSVEELTYTPGFSMEDEETLRYLKYHKKEKEIIEKVRGSNERESDYSFERYLDERGAIAWFKLFSKNNRPGWIVITKSMIYMYNGINEKEEIYFVPHLHLFVDRIYAEVVTNTNYYQKKTNVVGSAIVGGVIAGGTGAIIGAAAALNKGSKEVKGSTYATNYRNICVKGIFGDLGEEISSITAHERFLLQKLDGSAPIGTKFHTNYVNNIWHEKYEYFVMQLNDHCSKYDNEYLKKQAKKLNNK